MVNYLRNSLLVLLLALLAAQCRSQGAFLGYNGPPLPTPPTSPAIQIALLLPTTGEMATFGRALQQGSLMALDAWEQQGGLLGHRVEGVIYDTPCEIEAAQRVTQQVIEDGLKFIIGPLCSEAAIAAADIAAVSELLLMAPTATHPLVTVNHNGQTRPTIFRVSYTYPLQARAMARFARQNLAAHTAALFWDPGDDYATSLADTFDQEFSSGGGQIVYRATYGANDVDFAPVLEAVYEAGAEVIYLPASAAVVNRVADQLNQVAESSPRQKISLLGSDSWAAAELDLAATAGSYLTLHFVLEDGRSATQRWADAYKSTYAIAPDTLSALGYEAALVLTTAMQQAETFEVMAVVKALEEGKFNGVTGPIVFDAQHNPVKAAPVVQIKDERFIFSTYVNIPP